MYDMIIVGGGPAGLTAAIYGLRAGKSVLVIEKNGFGGQIAYSPKVENIPGTISISGSEFADKLTEQAMNLGADVELENVVSVEDKGEVKVVTTEEGSVYEGKTVILAVGVKHRTLGLDGEQELLGKGISFCAVCDGAFYKGRTVAVIGGGNSALQEAILLSESCEKVYVVQNLPEFTGETKLVNILKTKTNVEFIMGTVVDRLVGDSELTAIVLKDGEGAERELALDGMFVAIGLAPCNTPFEALAPLNKYGYFDTDETCKTATPGLFVAGDCRSKTVRQISTAIADGSAAAIAACRFLEENA